MASSLQRLGSNSGKAYRSVFTPLSRAFSTADSLVENPRREVLIFFFSYSQISGVILYEFLKTDFGSQFLVACILRPRFSVDMIKCVSSIPSLQYFPLRWIVEVYPLSVFAYVLGSEYSARIWRYWDMENQFHVHAEV